jgi:D-alanine--poly(phosphoribitol) ligase subunit 1
MRLNSPALSCDETKTLFDLFVSSRVAYGNRPALWVEGRTLTYAELHHTAAQIAGAIRAAHGGGRPFQCGLCVNRTPTAYAGLLASLMAGSAYVPLNPQMPCDRLRAIICASDIDTIIVDYRSTAAAMQLLNGLPGPLTVLLPDTVASDEWPLGHRYIAQADIESTAPVAPERIVDDGAYLLFTSGSTGAPKGVLISHANALAYLRSVTERYRPSPEDRFSQLFDFSFDLSVHDLFLAWGAGACLYCAPEGLAGISDFVRKCGLTFWLSVPTTAAFMRQMRMLKPGSFPTLRWSLFCGEALPMALARAWYDAAPNSIVENLYGPTEATVAFTTYRLSKEPCVEPPIVPIGMPLPGQNVMVIDDDGNPTQDGEVGELCLGGSQVAGGYWHAPELTAQRFLTDAVGMRWYRTGDLAVMSKDHGLIFHGRIDRQVKIRGYRVELLEVENAMRIAAETDTVGAIPWPIDDGGVARNLVGCVAGSLKSTGEIIARCRDALPSYMVPSRIHRINDWPLNANGKTDYQSLTAALQNAEAL